MSLHKLAAAGVLIALLAGCTAGPTLTVTPSPITSPGTGSPGPASSGGPPSPTVGPTPIGPSAEIELDVMGGPHDGSYRAVAPGGCESNPAGNRFNVDYADDAAPDGFVALHLVLRDAALAQEDESDDFLAEISLGGPGQAISYTIDPTNGRGGGSALLDVSPTDAIVDISADAPDGAQIELSIICGSA